MDNKKIYDAALQFVRDNKTWTDEEEQVALTNMDLRRCPLRIAYAKIHFEIYGLMDCFWQENDLQGEWYELFDDTDDVFINL